MKRIFFRRLTSALSVLTAVLGVSCGTTSPKVSERFPGQSEPTPPAGYRPAKAELLAIPGENCCLEFAPEGPRGERAILLSRRRPKHEHFQIYEIQVGSKKERRISFHDGDDQGATFADRGQSIIYASTTDELKEFPLVLEKFQAMGSSANPSSSRPNLGPRPTWSLQPFELYRKDLGKGFIERLTVQSGYDAEAVTHPGDGQIVFVSLRSERPTLHRMDAQLRVAKLTDSREAEAEPAFSPDGKLLAFVRFAEDFQSSQIYVGDSRGRKFRAITTGPGLKFSPRFLGDSSQILFSSNAEDAANYEVYLVRIDGTCPRRLTYSLGNDLLPRPSPTSTEVWFTSDRTGSLQIFHMPLQPPPCP